MILWFLSSVRIKYKDFQLAILFISEIKYTQLSLPENFKKTDQILLNSTIHLLAGCCFNFTGFYRNFEQNLMLVMFTKSKMLVKQYC